MVCFSSDRLCLVGLIILASILHIVTGHGSRFYFRPVQFFRPLYPSNSNYQKTTPVPILKQNANPTITQTPPFIPSKDAPNDLKPTLTEDIYGSGEIEHDDQHELKIHTPTSSDLSSPALDVNDYSKFSCRGRNPGYYADVRNNCQKYFRCVFDKQQSLWCPPKMRFDQSLFVCVRAEHALPCHKAPNYFSLNRQRFLQDSLIIDPSDEIRSQRFSCAGKKHGNYPDKQSKCRMFFQCNPLNVDGQASVVIICPEGFVFDKREGKCVSNYPKFICTN